MINRTEQEITSRWDLTAPTLVSISCATYNHEKYISKAVDSFLEQETDFPFEIIIGEDKSTDKTLQILKEYQEKYPNIIKLIAWPENVGASKNWATILQTCKGEYIANCEGDDYWIDKTKLQIQIQSMIQNSECNISFHPAKIVSGSVLTDQITARHSKNNRAFKTSNIIKGGGEFCPSASLVFKKSMLAELPNFFYDVPVGDYFLQIFGSVKGGALFLNRTMSAYRVNTPGSWSSSMEDLTKRKLFLIRFIDSMNRLNHHLNMKYESDINIMIDQQFRYFIMFCLKNNIDFKQQSNHYQYTHMHPGFRIKFIYSLGSLTNSFRLTNYVDMLIFEPTLFLKHVYNKYRHLVKTKQGLK